MRLLVTGANGFVSSHFLTLLNEEGIQYQRHVRKAELEDDFVADLSSKVDWSEALVDVDVVVHCAALVHQPDEKRTDLYDAVNVDSTLNLAKQAAKKGVKRFVFLSSIKVNGEKTLPQVPFIEHITSPPSDPYGLSKYKAEQRLKALAGETGMEVVIIRPPLVYGPGVKANFHKMMEWVYRGIPLPLKGTDNARSLVYVGNLTHFMLQCCLHPNAANQIFLVSDGHDVSTTKLLELLGESMTRKTRLLPFPKSFTIALLKLLGKKGIAERLFGSLQLNITHAQERLEWQPPYSLNKGLKQTVDHFLAKL